MFIRHHHLTGFQIRNVCTTSLPTNFHAFNIRFREDGPIGSTMSSKLLIQINSKQRLHLGDLQSFAPLISLLKQSKPVKAPGIKYDGIYKEEMWTYLPYPPGAKAFLYYSMPPERPRMAGELRLRLASDDNFASFESGSDLLLTNGRAWSRPLYSLSKYYRLLYEKLREDRLVPDDLDAAISTFPSLKPCYNRFNPLYTLNDPFVVNLNTYILDFWVFTEQGMGRLMEGRGRVRPYTGAYPSIFLISNIDYSHEFEGIVLARFERSTLAEHEGTRNIVFRFLKIITPVKCVIPHYNGYLCWPKEGELHTKLNLKQRVWSFNIDKSDVYRGFQLLWDG
jgi:hypothetical protein